MHDRTCTFVAVVVGHQAGSRKGHQVAVVVVDVVEVGTKAAAAVLHDTVGVDGVEVGSKAAPAALVPPPECYLDNTKAIDGSEAS